MQLFNAFSQRAMLSQSRSLMWHFKASANNLPTLWFVWTWSMGCESKIPQQVLKEPNMPRAAHLGTWDPFMQKTNSSSSQAGLCYMLCTVTKAHRDWCIWLEADFDLCSLRWYDRCCSCHKLHQIFSMHEGCLRHDIYIVIPIFHKSFQKCRRPVMEAQNRSSHAVMN